MKQNRGFTIIELMAVVSIISVLAVIALAVYTDYTIRSKVAEGVAFAAEARTAVGSYYYNRSKFPINNSQAGLPAANNYDRYKFVRSLEVTTIPKPGTVSVTFKIVGTVADGKVLQLVPDTGDGIVNWSCQPAEDNGLDITHAPPNCRG